MNWGQYHFLHFIMSEIPSSSAENAADSQSGSLSQLLQRLSTQAKELLTDPKTVRENPNAFVLEPLEDRVLLSAEGLALAAQPATPPQQVIVENNFNENTAAGLTFLMSNQENRRMTTEDGHVVMGVRDTLVSDNEYVPTAENPLEISVTAMFPKKDSLYILTRSDGTNAIGGYRSSNEVRSEIDLDGKALRIYEVQNGSMKTIAELSGVDLPLNEALSVHLKDDGSEVTLTVGNYEVSGKTTGTYGAAKTGISNWFSAIEVDDLMLKQGKETSKPMDDMQNVSSPSLFEGMKEIDLSVAEEDTALPASADRVLLSAEGLALAAQSSASSQQLIVQNDFNYNDPTGLSFLMSNQENRRMTTEDGHVVMGVRDTLLADGEYAPSAEKPLEVAFSATVPKQDSLYILTRSDGDASVGGYRSKNEVRVEVDFGAKFIQICEVQNGSMKTIAKLENVDLPLNASLPVLLTDDGSTVSIQVGDYAVSGKTTGTYGGAKTGISNWFSAIEVDDFSLKYGPEQPLQQTVSAQAEEDTTKNTTLLTEARISNQEILFLQGAQLLELSSFSIHGDAIEGMLQRTFPDLFPANLQEFVRQQAEVLNESGGSIQDRILMQQSDYRGIVTDLLGYYDSAMGRLLNQAVDMTARVQAGESEHDLMVGLRDAIGKENTGRYILELASFGVHIPSAEELYREGQRLYAEQLSLLEKMQSEQTRLQQVDDYRASDTEWQIAHGQEDMTLLAGGDEGTADNGYQGTISDGELRRLERAQRLMEQALGLPAGSLAKLQTTVFGTPDTSVYSAIEESAPTGVPLQVDAPSPLEYASATSSIGSESAEQSIAQNTLSRWYATAGEAPIDIDWGVDMKQSGNYRLLIHGFEGWDLKNATIMLDGKQEYVLVQTSGGFETVKDIVLPAGNHVLTLKNVGVPSQVGVTPGRFSLVKPFAAFDPNNSDFQPVFAADLETLLVTDYPEVNTYRIFHVAGTDGSPEVLNLQQLIEQFAPILHFSEGEDFPMPFPVESYNVPLTGDMNAEISVRNPLPNATPTIYASVLEKNGELAINYYFFYPMSNWGDKGGLRNTHEGDWEGVTVFLKNANEAYSPDRVAFGQHMKLVTSAFDRTDGGEKVDWNDVLKTGSRVNVYVGRGGHSSYPSPGIYNWPMSEVHGNDERIKDVQIEYLPRVTSQSSPNWLRYPGFWGSPDLDGMHEPANLQGDNAPLGPVFLSSGFDSGTRWLNPWKWSNDFNG